MSVVPIAFDISSLTPNTTYTFAVTPINARGISGIPSSFSINTPAVLYNTAVQNYNYQSVTLSISGAYKYVNINRNGVNIQTNYQGTLFFDSSGIQGLIPDMSYSYIITPYNRANVPSSLFKTVKVNTLPVVYNVDYTSDISSITLSISGIYSYISIFENINQYDIIVPHHDILHIPHYDLSYIPHYDISYIPHYDLSYIPHYDLSYIPHYDLSYIPHYDISYIPHYDLSYIPHYDLSYIPHYDISYIPHYDLSYIPHYDISYIPHYDLSYIPHYDLSYIPHYDLSLIPHYDLSYIPHYDLSYIPHYDLSLIPHYDLSLIPHYDLSLIPHYDLSLIPHYDLSLIPHYDLSYIPHYDISYIPHYDDSGNIVYDGSGNIVYDISYILLLDNSGNIVYDPSYILLYDNSGNVVYDPSMILLYDNSGNVVYDPSMILLYDNSGNVVYDTSMILLLDNSGNIVYDTSMILLLDNSGNIVYDPSMILLLDNSGNIIYDTSMILLLDNSGNIVYDPSMILLYDNSGNIVYDTSMILLLDNSGNIVYDISYILLLDNSGNIVYDPSMILLLDNSGNIVYDTSMILLYDNSGNIVYDPSMILLLDNSGNIVYDTSMILLLDNSGNIVYDISYILLLDNSGNIVYDPSMILLHDNSGNIVYDTSMILLYDNLGNIVYDPSMILLLDNSGNIVYDISYILLLDNSGNIVYDPSMIPLYDNLGNIVLDISHSYYDNNRIFDNSYTDLGSIHSGLTINSGYSYTITPYNHADISGSPITINTGTVPTINDISYTYHATSTSFIITGYYSYTSVKRNGILTGYTTNSLFNDNNNLLSNYTYSYVFTPANTSLGLDISGTSFSPISITTLPKIKTVTTVPDVSSIQLKIDGSYSFVTIENSGNIIVYDLYDISFTDTNGGSGLFPDTSYSYIVTPYNSQNISGDIITTIPVYTIPKLYEITNTYNDHSVNITVSGSYYYINILRNNILIAHHIYSHFYIDISGQLTDTGVGLNSNTLYNYTVVPYGYNDISGSSLTFSIDTMPILYAITNTNNANNIVLNISGNYSYVNIIDKDTNAFAGNVIYDSSYQISNLNPNTNYNYTVIPYNMNDISGTIVNVLNLLTRPTIYTVNYSPDVSSVSLTISGSYSYFDILRNSQLVQTNITGNTFTDLSGGDGLAADTLYNYTVIPYNANNVTGNVFLLTIDTIPIIYQISSTSYTSNIINLSISGYYETLDIYRDGSLLNTNYISKLFSDTSGLIPNRSYTYTFVPYNMNNVPGATSTPFTLVTRPIISFATNTFTTNSVTFTISGGYHHIDSSRDGIPYPTIFGDTFTDVSCQPNTSYSYSFVPYNSVNVTNDTYDVSNIITLPTIDNLNYDSSTNTIILQISGQYSYVDISRNSSNLTTHIADLYYTDTANLIADNSYTYIFTPFNANNIAGSSSTIVCQTRPLLYQVIYSSVTGTVITLSISGLYNYVDIARNGSIIISQLYDISYTDTDNTLSTDISFAYTVTPYNQAAFNGNSIVTDSTSLIPDVYFTGYTNLTGNSFTVNFAGFYNYVSIARSTSGTLGTYQSLSRKDISYNDYLLLPNTVYNYYLIPYNWLNNTNNIVTVTSNVSPISSVTFTGYANIKFNSLTVNFSNNMTFLYVSIARITDGVTGSYIDLSNGISTYTDTNLSAANIYSYSIRPYNAIRLSGTSIITGNVIVKPNITNVYYTNDPDNTDNSIIVNFVGSYSYVQIARNTNGRPGRYTKTNARDTSFNDTLLNPLGIYNYTVIPYDIYDVSGPTFTSIYTSETASVAFYGNAVATSANSISIPFSGSFYNITIFNQYLMKNNITNSPYVFTGLSPDMSYTFSLTPYNTYNVAGRRINTSIYTWGNVNNSISTVTGNSVAVGVSGNFYFVGWKNNTTGTSGNSFANGTRDMSNIVIDVCRNIIYDISRTIHYDLSYLPHYDICYIPHYDLSYIPHYDLSYIPHYDLSYIPRYDSCGNIVYDPSMILLLDNSGNIVYDPSMILRLDSSNNIVYDPSMILRLDSSKNIVYDISMILRLDSSNNIVYDPSMVIRYDSSGNIVYDTANIIRRDNSGNIVYNTIILGSHRETRINFTDTSGILPNRPYSYVITPYNEASVPASGSGLFNRIIYSGATINSNYTSTVTAYSVTVTISGIFSFVNWKNNVTNISGSSTTGLNYFIDVSNIMPNLSYNYTITPCNNDSVPNTEASIITGNIVTWGTITNIYPNLIGNLVLPNGNTIVVGNTVTYGNTTINAGNYVVMSVSGTFDSIKWINTTTGTFKTISGGLNTIVDTSGITQNKYYVYQIIPNNVQNTPATGSGIFTTNIFTARSVYSQTPTALFFNMITLNITGYFNAITWTNNVTGTRGNAYVITNNTVNLNYNSVAFYDISLMPHTAYTYSIVPYDYLGTTYMTFYTSPIYTLYFYTSITLDISGTGTYAAYYVHSDTGYGYNVYVFTSGTNTINLNIMGNNATLNVLCVGGGGGGGASTGGTALGGGGGGGGGVNFSQLTVPGGLDTVTTTVGNGGIGGNSYVNASSNLAVTAATNGANSSFNFLQNTSYNMTGVGGGAGSSVIISTQITLIAFTPEKVTSGTLIAWYDGTNPNNNSASIPANGSQISTWYDKSGLGNNLTQANSGNQPTYATNVQNGLNAVYLNGSQFMLNSTVAFPAGNYSVFAICKTTSNNGNWQRLVNGTTGDNRLLFGVNSGNDYDGWGNSGGWNDLNSTTIGGVNQNMQNIWYLKEIINSGTSTGWQPLINGTLCDVRNSAATDAFTGLELGGYSGGANQPWIGYAAEILIYNAALSTLNRQKVEGYLAWKWGLQTSLPSSHPYYSTLPYSNSNINIPTAGSGGSGGGGAFNNAGGAGTSNQGNSGGGDGSAVGATSGSGGSGGGAGAAGTNSLQKTGVKGGIGKICNLDGIVKLFPYYWGGGGGSGKTQNLVGFGGLGGGGSGCILNTNEASYSSGWGINPGGASYLQDSYGDFIGGNGGVNTGGGGGGGSPPSNSTVSLGGNGGSGIIILAIPTNTMQPIVSSPTINIASSSASNKGTSNGYAVHTFTQNGTFNFTSAQNVVLYILAVGGGGAGTLYNGIGGGGGGGAGGVVERAIVVNGSDVINITIGNGGGSGPYSTPSPGGNTYITFNNNTQNNFVAYGGGGAGSAQYGGSGSQGQIGGCGGGAQGDYTVVGFQSSPGFQGGGCPVAPVNNNANNPGGSTYGGSGGGGGGAGGDSVWDNTSNGYGNRGGPGKLSVLPGISSYYNNVYWAGGGGGGSANSQNQGGWCNGGIGGGGGAWSGTGSTSSGGGNTFNGVAGSNSTTSQGGNGSANTGGGGGGGGCNTNGVGYNGGNGGSGIVVISVYTLVNTDIAAVTTPPSGANLPPNLISYVSAPTVTPTSTSAMTIYFSGNYTNVTIYNSAPNSQIFTGITGTNYSFGNLITNTPYKFTVVPYDAYGVAGNSYVTSSTYTFPEVNVGSTTITNNNIISVPFLSTTVSGSYSYVNISLSSYNIQPGWSWYSYNSYHGENTNIDLTAARINGLNGVSTGTITDFTNLNSSTNNGWLANQSQHNFSIIWIGLIFTQSYSGTWNFKTTSDDGSYMWIGSTASSGYTTLNCLINNGGGHGMNAVSANISLSAYTYYPVRIMYGEGGGGYDMQFRFTPPGLAETANGTGFFYTQNSPSASINVTNITSSPYSYTGASPNTGYVFVITPYNISNVAGTAVGTPIIYTKPTIFNAGSPSVVSQSTILVPYIGQFNNLTISHNTASTISNVVTIGLQNYYKFNIADQVGSTVYDYGTGSYSATLTSGSTISTTQSKFGGASLYVSSGNGCTLPPYVFDGNVGMSITFWSYITGYSAGQPPFCMKYTSGTALANSGQILRIWYATPSSNAITQFVIDTDSTDMYINGTSVPFVNAWVHQSYVVSATGLSLYINGTLYGSMTFHSTLQNLTYASFSIGSDINMNGTLTGYFDEFRVYNRQLVLSDITPIYNWNGSITNSVEGISGLTGNYLTYNVKGFSNFVKTPDGYYVYVFTQSVANAIDISGAGNVYILAVGGGGSGGTNQSGGGGGGGVVQKTLALTSRELISINIGDGGQPAINKGNNGGSTIVSFSPDSSFNITAYGGGAGGSATFGAGNGGSGGGAGGFSNTAGTAVPNIIASGTTALGGNSGGTGNGGGGGGGGGAGAVGSNQSGTVSGSGGNGIVCSLTGISSSIYNGYYWGGGGGGSFSTGTSGGNGGLGGGGGAANYSGKIGIGGGSALNTGNSATATGVAQAGGAGGANTGGGGGGASLNSGYANGGAGGSGIVIIAIAPPSSYYLYSNSLVANTSYSFSLTPYNAIGVSGTVVTLPALYTLGQIYTCRLASYYSTSIDLSFSGGYTYVSIGNSLTTFNNIYGSQYRYTNLIANKLYTFSILPYNVSNISGTPFITTSIYTLPLITNVSVVPNSTTGLMVTYTGAYANTSIGIASNNTTITNYVPLVTTTTTTIPFPVTNLLFDFYAGSGTNIITNGGTVTSWTDAIKGVIATGNGTFNTSLQNGLPMISSGVLTTPSTGSGNVDNWTHFVVCKFGSSLSSTGSEAFFENSVSYGIQIGFSGNAASGYSACYNGIAWAPINSTATFVANGVYILAISYSFSGSTGTYVYRTNGVNTTQSPGYATTSYRYVAGSYIVSKGSFGGSTPQANGGYVGEQLFYNTTLSLAQMQSIEQYLSWKWSIPIGTPATTILASPFGNSSITATFTNAPNTIQNGSYYFSSSYNDYGAQYSNYQAFSYSSTNTNYWASNSHGTTTTVNGLFVYGEWLQVQIPVKINMTSFTTCSVNNSPNSIVIAGSTDGSVWYNVYTISTTGLYNTNSTSTFGPSINYATNTNTSFYNYFRFIVTSPGGSQTNLGKVNFSGVYTNATVFTGITYSPYFITGLAIDASYVVYVTPYNKNNLAGNTFVSSLAYTQPTAIVGVPYASSAYSITVPYTGNYDTVSIFNGLSNTVYGIVNSPYLFQGLLANTQYNFTVTPYNVNYNAGSPSTSLSIFTYGNVFIQNAYAMSTSSVLINYSGRYQYVSITNNSGNAYAQVYTASPFLYTNLIVNTPYTFSFVPYNNYGVAGNTVSTSVVCTLPNVQFNSYSPVTANIVNIYFTGAFNNVSIIGNSDAGSAFTLGNVFNGISGSPYTFTGLLPNTTYTFNITPYNFQNISGDTITTTSFTTPTFITGTAAATSSTSISIPFSGIYDTVTIDNSASIVNTGITTAPYNFTGLSQNTYYNFNVTPITGSVSGNTLPIISTCSWGEIVNTYSENNILNSAVTNTPNMNIYFTGTYSSVNISNNRGNVYTGITSSPFLFTGLDGSSNYTFTITPYNQAGIAGVSVDTASRYSISSLFANITNIYDQAVQFNFVGYYSYVNITNTTTGNTVTGLRTSPYLFTGLNINTNYNFVLTGYNGNAIVGNTFTFNASTTLYSQVYNTSAISSSAANIYFTGVESSVGISNTQVSISGSPIVTSIIKSPYTYTGLSPNIAYNFYVYPYTSQGTWSYTNYTPTLTVYTWASITGVTFSVSGSLTIIVATIAGRFSGIYWRNLITGTTSNFISATNSVVINDTSGIVLNAMYYYNIIPVNSFGFSPPYFGSPGTYTTIYAYKTSTTTITTATTPTYSLPSTSGTFIGAKIIDSSVNTIGMEFAGYYTSLSIYNNVTGNTITNVTSNPYYVTSLIPLTKYTFTIIPYYNATVIGNAFLNTTATTVAPFTVGDITDASNNNLFLPFYGSYNNITVTTKAGNSNIVTTGITSSPFVLLNFSSIVDSSIIITPYDICGNRGTVITKSPIFYGRFINDMSSNNYSSTTTSITLSYSGMFSTVSIISGNAAPITGITTPTYSFTSLTPGTQYSFQIIPYDINGNAGNAVNLSASTLSTITYGNVIASSATSITVNYEGNNSSLGQSYYILDNSNTYSYDTNVPFVLGLSGNPYVFTKINTSGATGAITTPLQPNSTYTSFYLYPYNNVGVINRFSYINVPSIYTWGIINSVTYIPTLTTITLFVTGIFSSIAWKNTSTGIIGNTLTGTNTITFTDVSGLSPFNFYNYSLIPYNINGIGPLDFNTPGTYTLSNTIIKYGYLNLISQAAYNTCQGAYACFLVNNNYTGPIIKLRNFSDKTGASSSDFYSDICGNMTTGPNGTGISLNLWLADPRYAFVTKWYDQSVLTTNHATQNTLLLQPVFDVSFRLLNFGYAGSNGGYVGTVNSQAYLNLPNSALPYNDSSYTYVSKLWNLSASNSNAGVVSGGSNGSKNMTIFIVYNASLVINAWYGNDLQSSVNFTPNSVISATYNGTTRTSVVNNSVTSAAASSRAQNNTLNFIGQYNEGGNVRGINGQMYYLYVFGSALTTRERNVIESTTRY